MATVDFTQLTKRVVVKPHDEPEKVGFKIFLDRVGYNGNTMFGLLSDCLDSVIIPEGRMLDLLRTSGIVTEGTPEEALECMVGRLYQLPHNAPYRLERVHHNQYQFRSERW